MTVVDATDVPPIIPHPYHFTLHGLNANCSTTFCCLMIFARAHFDHLYANQGSMGESKPMIDENWNIKYLRSRAPHLESY